MSFIKGEFYRCIDNGNGTIPFTIGRCYQCVSSNTDMHVINDRGTFYIASAHRFDPKPVSVSPGYVSRHAPLPAPPIFGSHLYKTPDKEPVCCGEKPEKKVFATFEYLFCNKCKKEVGGKAEEKKPEPLTKNHIQAALDAINVADADYDYTADTIKKMWMGS